MVSRIEVIPSEVRGYGNIVDPKTVDDFTLVDSELSYSDGVYSLTAEGAPVSYDGIVLSSNKSVLSYIDSETATLSAQLMDGEDPDTTSGVTVSFYNGTTSLGTATTDSSGVATKSYTSTGAGDLSLTAKVGTLVSETYVIEDCYAYATSFSNWTSHTNKGTSYLFSPFTLPTNHRIEFKLKSTNAVRVACGDMTHTNSGGWLEWIYAWYVDSKKLYYRDSNNGEQDVTSSYTVSTSSVYAVEYNGTSLKIYNGSTQLQSLTSYDTLTLTRYIRLNANSGTVPNNLDWIKVKQL